MVFSLHYYSSFMNIHGYSCLIIQENSWCNFTFMNIFHEYSRIILEYSWNIHVHETHWIGGSLKLLWESTNADQKRLKMVFLIANCRFRLPICNLKRCFNAYRYALLDSRDSLRLPPIWCVISGSLLKTDHGDTFQWGPNLMLQWLLELKHQVQQISAT